MFPLSFRQAPWSKINAVWFLRAVRRDTWQHSNRSIRYSQLQTRGHNVSALAQRLSFVLFMQNLCILKLNAIACRSPIYSLVWAHWKRHRPVQFITYSSIISTLQHPRRATGHSLSGRELCQRLRRSSSRTARNAIPATLCLARQRGVARGIVYSNCPIIGPTWFIINLIIIKFCCAKIPRNSMSLKDWSICYGIN